MNPDWKQRLRPWLPAAVLSWWRERHSLHFTGPYQRWSEAVAAGGSYADPDILARVAKAARAVRDGQAAFERDGLLFKDPAPDPIFVTELTRLARKHAPGPLTVFDFGGSLGSTFYQHRGFLSDLCPLRWHIVEQPHFAALGRQEFESEGLRFFDSIDEALTAGPPALVIASSVFPYLESPWPVIERLAALPAAAWIVSRTAFCSDDPDNLFVQHVPPSIYRANYPLWALAQPTFERLWSRHAKSITWHPTPEGGFSTGGRELVFKTAVIRAAAMD